MSGRRIAEIAMHMFAAACIVLGFLLLGLGTPAIALSEPDSGATLVSLLSVGLALAAFVSEIIALALRTRRV